MVVLFMVVSFLIGCVDWMSQSFLSECVFFSIIVLGLVVMDFYLSLPVGDKFSGQMINETISWLLGLDRIFK